VTEKYIVNLPLTIAFYGRHLNNFIYSSQAFIKNFLNFFFIVVGLRKKYMQKTHHVNNVKRKCNFDIYKYRCEALGCCPPSSLPLSSQSTLKAQHL
jgi:hypothetical protein